MLNPFNGAPPAEHLTDYWLMQMLILLKPPLKRVIMMKDAAALDPTAAKQLLVMSVLLPISHCESEGVDGEGKARMRDEGRGAGKRDWVRRIAACRGQTLSRANIVIRCSIRLQLSDIECRQCVSASPGATLCFLQFHLAARPTRSHRLLGGSQNKSPGRQISGAGLPKGLATGPGAWVLPCCLTDYTPITTPRVLLRYAFLRGSSGDLQHSWLSESKLPCSFNRRPPLMPAPPQSTNIHHRPMIMRDNRLEIREF